MSALLLPGYHPDLGRSYSAPASQTQNVPSVTFPHHLFPTYVIKVLEPEKGLKERCSGGVGGSRGSPHLSSTFLASFQEESIRNTAPIGQTVADVCKQNSPCLHFLRLPLLMRNIWPAGGTLVLRSRNLLLLRLLLLLASHFPALLLLFLYLLTSSTSYVTSM